MFGSRRRARRATELARLEILGEQIRAEAERREPDVCRGCVRMEMARYPGMDEGEATWRVQHRRTSSSVGATMDEAAATIAHNFGHPGANYPPQGPRPSAS